ncbi:MAG TPA: hypothetical protein VGR35_20525 [Tepidisphaeraceae bacterium]|nr:hypothetical protein [Tepidisphaeraceae bacterium]
MTKRRITILALAVCVVAGGVTVAVLAKGDRLHAKPRREWKEQAIAKIERRLNDRKTLESALDGIERTLATTRPAPGVWVGEDVLVMKNGDWIAYESICSKEDSRIHDLFIGRGSDGKWYYSTFHFCIGMTVLRHMEDWQPDSLAQFADAYLLVPFDGRSDESLKETWTGAEPYGQGKLRMAGTTSPAQ